jgi:flagellar secretion chaperone FliS
MYGKNSALASYGKVANTETDPIQQIVMLYDGAIRFLRLAGDDIENKRIAEKAHNVNRALDIINYLQSTLDFDKAPEVANTLDRLYTAVSMQVLQASAKLDAVAMRAAADHLAPVRDSWTEVARGVNQPATLTTPIPAEPQRLGQLVFG